MQAGTTITNTTCKLLRRGTCPSATGRIGAEPAQPSCREAAGCPRDETGLAVRPEAVSAASLPCGLTRQLEPITTFSALGDYCIALVRRVMEILREAGDLVGGMQNAGG